MTERSAADRVGHGEASLGEAQSRNPHADPEDFPPNRDFDPEPTSSARATRRPGDYVVSDRLVVERKGPTDLAASIKDRRLFERLARLADAYPSVVLIVEGDPVHMQQAAWQGALGRALTLGASRCAPRTRATPPNGSPAAEPAAGATS